MSVTQALKHTLPVHADDGAVPLKLRLRAWWHGASVQEVLAAEAERGGGDNAAVLELIGAVVEEPEPEGPGAFWSNSRIAVTEMLFGNGEIVPGGTEGTLDMIGAFGLGQEVNVLNIGAGLGGSARAIASEYEGWVTAYEPDAALAEAALDPARLRNLKKTTGGSSLKPMKVRMKLSDKATIQHADLETLEIKPGVYDCAFSRDVLFTVANRSRLVEGIFEGLKPFSPFVFTDYFVAEGAADDPRVLRWMQSEPHPVHPWTSAEAEKMLTAIGFDLRVAQDITAGQRCDILRGFGAFVAAHEKSGIPGDIIEALLGFAELWGNRVAVMDAGLVTIRKFVALRPKGV